MKKLIVTALILMTVTLLNSCMYIGAAIGTSTKNKKEYQAAVGTPKDSVVFYGAFNNNLSESFSQMDPEFPPDYQEMEKAIFISKPVAPGSTYVLAKNSGNYTQYVGNIRYIYSWNNYTSLQTALNPLIINVPKKPGLYYVGSYDFVGMSNEKFEPMKNSKEMEEVCIKGALKLYKGTAWESAFNTRLEEIKNAK